MSPTPVRKRECIGSLPRRQKISPVTPRHRGMIFCRSIRRCTRKTTTLPGGYRLTELASTKNGCIRGDSRHHRGRRNTNPLQMFQRYIGSASDRQHEQSTENGSCCPRHAFCNQTHSITFFGYKESSSTKGSWSRFCQSASTKCRSYRS